MNRKIHTRILRFTFKWDSLHGYKFFSLGFDMNHRIWDTTSRILPTVVVVIIITIIMMLIIVIVIMMIIVSYTTIIIRLLRMVVLKL